MGLPQISRLVAVNLASCTFCDTPAHPSATRGCPQAPHCWGVAAGPCGDTGRNRRHWVSPAFGRVVGTHGHSHSSLLCPRSPLSPRYGLKPSPGVPMSPLVPSPTGKPLCGLLATAGRRWVLLLGPLTCPGLSISSASSSPLTHLWISSIPPLHPPAPQRLSKCAGVRNKGPPCKMPGREPTASAAEHAPTAGLQDFWLLPVWGHRPVTPPTAASVLAIPTGAGEGSSAPHRGRGRMLWSPLLPFPASPGHQGAASLDPSPAAQPRQEFLLLLFPQLK